jgi:hypothetical protein
MTIDFLTIKFSDPSFPPFTSTISESGKLTIQDECYFALLNSLLVARPGGFASALLKHTSGESIFIFEAARFAIYPFGCCFKYTDFTVISTIWSFISTNFEFFCANFDTSPVFAPARMLFFLPFTLIPDCCSFNSYISAVPTSKS